MIYIFVSVFQAIEEPEKQEYLKQELWIKDKFDVSSFHFVTTFNGYWLFLWIVGQE